MAQTVGVKKINTKLNPYFFFSILVYFWVYVTLPVNFKLISIKMNG